MKNPLARFRETGSFIAGLLTGLSIVVPLSAMMVADPSDWQTLWVFGAPIILALGLTLQVAVTGKPRHRRTADPELGALPIRFVELSHER
jgi:hypothetical protein